MLEAMVTDANNSSSLSNLHLVTACLLSFAGFPRFDELINLRPCDFTFDQDISSVAVLTSCDRVMKSWWLGLTTVLAQQQCLNITCGAQVCHQKISGLYSDQSRVLRRVNVSGMQAGSVIVVCKIFSIRS